MTSSRYTDIKVLPNGRQVYIYDEDGIAERKSIKVSKISKIKREIGSIISRVEKDISEGSDQALIVGLILCTYERVGNDESASSGHYGASNLERRHVKKIDGGILIEYVAKSGVSQSKPVFDKLVVSEILSRIKSKRNSDRIFTSTPKQVNEYLDQFGITSKDIRTFAANKFMADALFSEKTTPTTKNGRNKVFKEKLDSVAGIIGHKPSTLKSMYLSDSLKDDYLESGIVKRFTRKKK